MTSRYTWSYLYYGLKVGTLLSSITLYILSFLREHVVTDVCPLNTGRGRKLRDDAVALLADHFMEVVDWMMPPLTAGRPTHTCSFLIDHWPGVMLPRLSQSYVTCSSPK